MLLSAPHSRLLGWAVLLGAFALLALAVPGIGYAKAATTDGVRLEGGPHEVEVSADRKYGIYVDDADNSGYSESCSATDSDGRVLRMSSPGWTISTSDTEVLDLVFDTGTGHVTIDCSVPGERVTLRPVPNLLTLAVGLLVAGASGTAAVIMLVLWIVRASARPAPEPVG